MSRSYAESGAYCENRLHFDRCLDKRRVAFIKLPLTAFPSRPPEIKD